jgi:hypothetical protein
LKDRLNALQPSTTREKIPASASVVHVSRYFYRISMEVVIIKIAKRFDKYASAPETACLR